MKKQVMSVKRKWLLIAARVFGSVGLIGLACIWLLSLREPNLTWVEVFGRVTGLFSTVVLFYGNWCVTRLRKE